MDVDRWATAWAATSAVAPGGGRARVSPLHGRLSPLFLFLAFSNRRPTTTTLTVLSDRLLFLTGELEKAIPLGSTQAPGRLTLPAHVTHSPGSPEPRFPPARLAFIAYIASISFSLSLFHSLLLPLSLSLSLSFLFLFFRTTSRLTGALQSPARTSSCTYDVSTYIHYSNKVSRR